METVTRLYAGACLLTGSLLLSGIVRTILSAVCQ